VLSEEERAKGFVRPVRHTYRHVGLRPQYTIRPLTREEEERFADLDYVGFEPYPDDGTHGSATGRYWTDKDLKSGCGAETTMSHSIAETYAAKPQFYGSTFCVRCRGHFPVGHHGEFVWVGSDERVGT
jgi:hypothetical protein